MKAKKRWPKVGDLIFVDHGQDPNGQWWWKSGDTYGGPFATEAECTKHSQVALLGPQCKVEFGGQWDSAWDQKQ